MKIIIQSTIIFNKKYMLLNNPISAADAAKLVGMSPQNFRWYILRGETPEPVKIGRGHFFEREEIKNWQKPYKKPGRKAIHND